MIKQFWGWEPWSHDSYHETPRWIFHGIWPQHFGESWVPELTKSKLPKWTNNTSNIVAYVHSMRKDFIVSLPWLHLENVPMSMQLHVITMTINLTNVTFDSCMFLKIQKHGQRAYLRTVTSKIANDSTHHYHTMRLSPPSAFPLLLQLGDGKPTCQSLQQAQATPSHEKGRIYLHFCWCKHSK